MKTIIGVVQLLNPAVTRHAVTLSRALAAGRDNPGLVLSQGFRRPAIPHLSHIHLVRPEGHVRELVAALKLAVAPFRCATVSGKLSGIGLRRNWVFWETPRTEVLNELHQVIIETVSRFASKPVPITWPMNNRQTRMHQLYGYPACGEEFDPHVTLSIFPADKINVPLVEQLSCRSRWASTHLAIGQIATPGGRLVKVLHRIALY